jgi:hypothetical protein
VSPGDAYERTSYCVLSGESVARAVADPACNRVVAAEATEAVTRRYADAVDVKSSASPTIAACPQPWCSFSLIRLRLTELGAGYSASGSQPSR